jgi:hypothetical protein
MKALFGALFLCLLAGIIGCWQNIRSIDALPPLPQHPLLFLYRPLKIDPPLAKQGNLTFKIR